MANIFAVRVAASHGAGGGKPGVLDGSSSGQNRHVEPNIDGLNACVVNTPDSVGFGFECDKFGMLLNHQDKVGFSLNKKHKFKMNCL